jgi:hypothetical protein
MHPLRRAGLLVLSLAMAWGPSTSVRSSGAITGRSLAPKPLAAGLSDHQEVGSVQLRLRGYNNRSALVALENDTDHPIYPAYEPTTRRRVARLVYHLEREVAHQPSGKALYTEVFDAFPGWNPMPQQTAVVFQARCDPGATGHFRIVVDYLEDPDTVAITNDILRDPKTFDQKIARRNRDMKSVVSEWFTLPVRADVVVEIGAGRRAVNELPGPGEQDVIENELAVIGLLMDIYSNPWRVSYARLKKASEEGYRGYIFSCTLSRDVEHYQIVAVPERYGEAGVFSFYSSDATGPIRAADKQGGPATVDDQWVFKFNSRWR